ncbi:MAG: hypothetical protein RLZZ455_870, partial [Candidatus Parcubacteria bacterium]|jgi:hypothetical protein
MTLTSNSGGKAAFILNKMTNAGDIFAASISGVARFRITSDGSINVTNYATVGASLAVGNVSAPTGNGIINVSGNYQVRGTNGVTATDVSCFAVTGGIVTSSTGSCANSAASPFESLTGGIIAERNITQDFLIGGVSTASAKFAVLNVNSGVPTATVSGNLIVMPLNTAGVQTGGWVGIGTPSPKGLLDVRDNLFVGNPNGGTLGNSIRSNLNQYNVIDFGSSDGFGISSYNGVGVYLDQDNNDSGEFFKVTTNSDTREMLRIVASGNVGIGTSDPIGLLNVSGDSGFVSLVKFNQLGTSANNDIFTASAGGTPRFTITNAGGIKLGTSEGIASQCLLSGGAGAAATWGSCGAASGGTWTVANGAIFPNQASVLDVLIGGTSTAAAKFAFINVLTGTPTTTISGNLSLQAPTAAGSTNTLSLLNASNLNVLSSVGGDGTTTSRMFINGNTGNVGFGTTSPEAYVHLSRAGDVPLNLYVSGQNSSIGLRNTSDPISQGLFRMRATAFQLQFNANQAAAGDFTAEKNIMALTSDGNVGIGTTAPVGRLHLTGSTGGNALSIINETGSSDIFTASSSGTTRFAIQADGTLLVGGTRATNAKFAVLNVSSGIPTATVAGNFIVMPYQNGANWTGGRVGFGTTDLRANLNIVGVASISAAASPNSVFGLNFAPSTNGSAEVSVLDGGALHFKTSPGDRNDPNGNFAVTTAFSIWPSGNVSVGTANSSGIAPFNVFKSLSGRTQPLMLIGNNSSTAGAGSSIVFVNSATVTTVQSASISAVRSNFPVSGGTYLSFATARQNAASPVGAKDPIEALRISELQDVGIGVTNPYARLQVSGGQNGLAAAFIVDQVGDSANDILSASASGTTKLVLSNSGNLTLSNYANAGAVLYTSSTGLISQVTGGSASNCLLGGGGTTPTWGSCSGSPSTGNWTDIRGTIFPNQANNSDLLIGGSATSSAKFAVLNMTSGTPTASVAGDLIVMPWTNGTSQTGGNLGIGTTSPTHPIHAVGIVPNAANSVGFFFAPTMKSTNNQTGLSTESVVNAGADSSATYTSMLGTMTSYQSGTTLQNATLIGLRGYAYIGGSGTYGSVQGGNYTVELDAAGTISNAYGLTVNNAVKSAGTINNLFGLVVTGQTTGTTSNVGMMVGPSKLATTNIDLLVGATSVPTTSTNLYVQGGQTHGNAAVIIDQVGAGDIFTASDSGVTQFVIDSTGRVGIGTSSAYLQNGDKLTVSGNIKLEAKPTSNVTTTNWTKITNSTPGTLVTGGTSGIASVSATAVYNGSLYVGTSKTDSAEVYRYDGSSSNWTRVNTAAGQFSSRTGINGVTAMTVYNGSLYIGTTEPNGAEVYRFNGAQSGVGTSTWTQVSGTTGTIGSGQANTDGVSSLVVHAGRLYAGTSEPAAADVLVYDAGASFNGWTRVNSAAGTVCTTTLRDEVTSMVSFQGSLFATVRKGYDTRSGLCRMAGGNITGVLMNASETNWDVTTGDLGSVASESALTVYNGRLMIGMRDSNAANVIGMEGPFNAATLTGFDRFNSATGTITQGGTASIDGVTAMTVYNGKLYIGTEELGAAGSGGAEVYQYAGQEGRWIKVSQTTAGTIASGGTAGIATINHLIPWNGKLYAMTSRGGTVTNGIGGAEIYEYTGPELDQSSYALKFHSATSGTAGGELGGYQNIASIYFSASSSASTNNGANNQGSFVFSHGLTTTGGGFDVAEDYPTWDTSLEPGELVSSADHEPGFVERSSGGTYSNKVIGVYSEKPGFRLSQKDDFPNGSIGVPIALVGRVPVKVSTENGVIRTGDALTTSSVPGVAMKSTQPGMIIGRSMGDFDCSATSGPFGPDASASASTDQVCTGKVLTYINVSYYDPQVAFTALGDLNVVDVQGVDHENDALAQVLTDPERFEVRGKNGEKITAVGAFKEAAIGTLKAGSIDVQKLSIGGVDLMHWLNGYNNLSSTDAAHLATRITGIESSVTSQNEKLTSLEQRLQNVEELASLTASAAAFMGDLQLETLSSSDAAMVTTELATLGDENATVSGDLTVLGRTLLTDLGVTGNISAGLLVLNGDDGAIDNAGGVLKLQSYGVGGVDILAGKVIIDDEGNITTVGTIVAKEIKAEKVTTEKIQISTGSSDTGVLSASAGQIVIKAGKSSIDVTTSALTTKSLIFTTPEDPVAVGSKKKDADTFTVTLAEPTTKDLKVNWWIVN